MDACWNDFTFETYICVCAWMSLYGFVFIMMTLIMPSKLTIRMHPASAAADDIHPPPHRNDNHRNDDDDADDDDFQIEWRKITLNYADSLRIRLE